MTRQYISSQHPVYVSTKEPHQGRTLWIHPWVENPGYTTPSARTVYQVIQGKLLVRIEPGMSKSTAHPKPSTN